MSETSTVTTPLIKAINALPWCRAHRIQAGKTRVRGGFMQGADKGFPDVGAVVRGVPVYFETKAPKQNATAVQRQVHDELRRAGALVFVVRSVDAGMGEVRKILGMSQE